MLGTPKYFGNSAPAHAAIPATAVLLVNIGTPQAPTAQAVRPYLAEFLSDPRVIEAPRWLWWLVLHGVILRIRPARSARAYAKIWTAEGSPLRVQQQALAEQLSSHLAHDYSGRILVRSAMRYGEPSIERVLKSLLNESVRRLLVLPLYPQYSASATGSAFDALTRALQHWRWPPELRFINSYHDHQGYIEALAAQVQAHWREHGRAQRLVLSFHGIPERYFRAGDPYFCQCHASARLLAERLQLTQDEWLVCFQSRVGRERWLKPYTGDVLSTLAQQGVRHIQMVCPGFAVDCLETLEEIAIAGKAQFLAAGGERFEYIAALNATSDHVKALADLIVMHGQGWPEFNPQWSTELAAAKAAKTAANYDRMQHARN